MENDLEAAFGRKYVGGYQEDFANPRLQSYDSYRILTSDVGGLLGWFPRIGSHFVHLNTRCRDITYNKKGPIILGTTHMTLNPKLLSTRASPGRAQDTWFRISRTHFWN